MLADGLLVPEIVMLRQQTVEEAFVRRAAHLMERHRSQRAQRRVDRRGVDQDRWRTRARPPRLARRPLRWRELDVAPTMQPQQQASANRIAGQTVRLPPLPLVAERQGQRAAAETWRCPEEPPNRREIRGGDRSTAIPEREFHGRERTKRRRRTQVPLPGPNPAPHRRGIARRRVAAHDQPLELMRLQQRGRRATRRPPAKAPAREPFLGQPKSLRVVDQTFDRAAAAIPKHEQRPAEGINVEDVAADAREAINPLSKILSLDGHQNPHLRCELDHASTPAITRLSRARSGSPIPCTRIRTDASGPTISITQSPPALAPIGVNSTNRDR